MGLVPHQSKRNDDEYNVTKTIMIATGCRQDAADANTEVSMSLGTKLIGFGYIPPALCSHFNGFIIINFT